MLKAQAYERMWKTVAIPWKQLLSDKDVSREFKRIPLRQIRKNPNQPRKLFDVQALQELADSVRQVGIITPLTVRRTEDGYELIAGERRLRAAVMAGLSTVPCYIVEVDGRMSALMALVENLQRADLDCFEEAASLRRLCEEYHMSQKTAADCLGMTQGAVANKLRLLRLGPAVVKILRENQLSERHARALLRLEEGRQEPAARVMAQRKLTVAQAERYVDKLLEETPAPRRRGVVKDVRLFCNTVERAVSLMREGGLSPAVEKTREGETLVLTVRIPAAFPPEGS